MRSAPTPLEPGYSALTHAGRVREVNEDAILAQPEPSLWLVADGMGGHEGGAFASKAIVDALASLPPALSPADLMHLSREALQGAHRRIKEEGSRRGGCTMGATAVLLIIAEGHFLCLWVGDSRLYRLRDGRLEMLSVDHSMVGDLVLAGDLTWAEAEHHPQANEITRAVGVGDRLDIDKRRGEAAPGDRFLLCSDGLTKHVKDRAIEQILTATPVRAAADALLQQALDGGGTDNISVIVVEV